MSPSDAQIIIFECRSCAFNLCERKTSQQDAYTPIHKGGINPGRQSETRSNDGENAFWTSESGLDHKAELNNDHHHRRFPSWHNEVSSRTVFVVASISRWLLTKTFTITETVHTFNVSDGLIPIILNFHTHWYCNVKPRSILSLLNHRQNTNIFIKSQELKIFYFGCQLVNTTPTEFQFYNIFIYIQL